MQDYLKVLDEAAAKNAELARKQYDPEIPEKIEYEDLSRIARERGISLYEARKLCTDPQENE